MSNVETSGSQPPGSCFSVQRSGIVNGLTHVSAFAGDASAVAVAPTLAFGIPKYRAMKVDSGLPRSSVRNTFTLTRFESPVGPTGKVTSGTSTDTFSRITWLPRAAASALVTAGPVAVRSS